MTENYHTRINSLSKSQQDLVSEIIHAFESSVTSKIDSTSNICTEKFAEDFQNRIVLYHAMNEELLNKKTFEYALRGACRFDGRSAELNSNSTNAGADITIDGRSFSLKTEASSAIKRSHLTISKIMEARWIRDCNNGAEFLRGLQHNFIAHLRQYQRILMLRGFVINPQLVEYMLVEIPLDILLQSQHLSPSDFKPQTVNGTTSAKIQVGGKQAFTLRLDGSVEKITISLLSLELCQIHGSWQVPVITL
jgi:hypothetical protein